MFARKGSRRLSRSTQSTADALPRDPDTIARQPSELTAVATGTDEITLTWRDNAESEDGYVVERREVPTGQWQEATGLRDDAQSYTDPNVQPNTA